VAKPRSPILGYNHNIRYRGLVFHVQTEDSGITNPHVFTHLFHGGVILSTRKLVYDASASEDAVKGLMQAQHKAVLKDLKRGNFDDKMDSYLGGTPGLLPRGQGVEGEMTAAPAVAPPPPAEPEPAPPPVVGRVPTPVPTPASIAIPPPSRASGRIPAIGQDTIEARAPTERFAPEAHGASPLPPPPPLARGTDTTGASTRQSMSAPGVETRPVENDATERNVSAAFQAIMVEEGAAPRPGGGLVEVPDDEPVIEIHSPAPPSAATPPGFIQDQTGRYAQHRRRESGRFSPDGEMLPPGGAALPAAQVAAATKQQVTRGAGTGSQAAVRPPTTPPPVQRAAGPLTRPQTPMARPPTTPPARPSVLPTYPSGRPPSPAPRAQTQARTRSPSAGGVVVTRPAVIIGAPSRTVGGAAPPPPAAAAAPPPPAQKQPPRVRKAREDSSSSDSGVFGQDLISEKSLDEVILAYLSEDPAEE
jgi:hypothetical protein